MSSNGCTYCVYIVQENLQKNPPTSFLQHAHTKSDRQTDRQTYMYPKHFICGDNIRKENKPNMFTYIALFYHFYFRNGLWPFFIKIIHILPLHNYIFILFDSLFGRDKQCSLVSICTGLRY